MPRHLDIYKAILGHFHTIHRVMRQQGGEDKHDLHALTLLQMQTLSLVQQHGLIKMSDLAHELHVSPAALTVLINRLVKTNWLERVPDPTDRRTVSVRLTAHAKTRFAQLHDQKVRQMQVILDKLSATELKQLHRILEHLSTIITTESK